jgi:hypothetical protein
LVKNNFSEDVFVTFHLSSPIPLLRKKLLKLFTAWRADSYSYIRYYFLFCYFSFFCSLSRVYLLFLFLSVVFLLFDILFLVSVPYQESIYSFSFSVVFLLFDILFLLSVPYQESIYSFSFSFCCCSAPSLVRLSAR